MRNAAAMLLLSVLVLGCGRKLPCEKPEDVVSEFFLSIKYGSEADLERAFQLMAGEDRRVLTERAEAMKDMQPHELLLRNDLL